MYVAQPFHFWVPKWVTVVIAFFLIITQNLINGISSYSIGEITSSLGQDSELVKIAFYSSSIGLVTMYPIYVRLRQLLQRKRMLLIFLMLELILCIIGPTFRAGWEFILISFLLGAVKCVCLIDTIGLLMPMLNPKNSRGLFYGIYYPIAYTSGQVVGYLGAYMVINYEWAFSYYMSVPCIFISIGLVLFFMHSFRNQRKIPFYRFDWTGLMLFTFFAFSLTGVCVYGEQLNWFGSSEIQIGALLTALSLVLFVYRELTIRRPCVDFSVLKRYSQIPLGIALMLIMYVGYNSGGIMSSYMEGVLKYDHLYVAKTSIYMIISFATVIPLVGWMLSKHYPVRIFLFIGFLFFAIYHFICSHLFYIEQDINDLILTQILKGTAYGMTITTLSYYASQHVPREYNGHRAFFSIAVRFVLAVPITSAIFTHWQAICQRLHYTFLSANFTSLNTVNINNVQMLSTAGGTSMTSIVGRLSVQSLLLSGVDIYTMVGVLCLAIAIAILFIKHLDVHYTKEYKSYTSMEM